MVKLTANISMKINSAQDWVDFYDQSNILVAWYDVRTGNFDYRTNTDVGGIWFETAKVSNIAEICNIFSKISLDN
jgi:hypothetical protein